MMSNPRLLPKKKLSSLILALFVSGAFMAFTSCGLLGTAMSLGLAKLQFGCLPEGTLVDTPNGGVAVEDLEAGDRVIGYDGEAVVIRQVHQYQEDATQTRHLTVVFEGGATVQLSPRHRISGVPAGDLKVGDELGDFTVQEISPLGSVSRSFDLLTDDAGYQIQGVPVNSMIREMAR